MYNGSGAWAPLVRRTTLQLLDYTDCIDCFVLNHCELCYEGSLCVDCYHSACLQGYKGGSDSYPDCRDPR